MPDISMCLNEDCPMRTRCYRSPDSGTKPTPGMQSWIRFAPDADGQCDWFEEKRRKTW